MLTGWLVHLRLTVLVLVWSGLDRYLCRLLVGCFLPTLPLPCLALTPLTPEFRLLVASAFPKHPSFRYLPFENPTHSVILFKHLDAIKTFVLSNVYHSFALSFFLSIRYRSRLPEQANGYVSGFLSK